MHTQRPYGVPLDDLLQALKATDLKVVQDDCGLLVQHLGFITRVRVLPPPNINPTGICAVVDIQSELPEVLIDMLDAGGEGAGFNGFATMGAITKVGGRYFVGSRLTIFESENAWNIHFPLLLFTVISATDLLLAAVRGVFSETSELRSSVSDWDEADLQKVESTLSEVSVCFTDGLVLTAEFGLGAGQVAAIAGHKTALLQVRADEPHPETGGLLCLLQMPDRYEDKKRLQDILAELNRLETTADDLPPHFGAWCPGKSGNNPAYISFFPNFMHEVPGIATNLAIWAMHRADWAMRTLEILKVEQSMQARQQADPATENTVKQAKAASPMPNVPAIPSSGHSRVERVQLARAILGYGLSDDQLDAITQAIGAQLARRPQVLSSRDHIEIIQPIQQEHRSILFSELERVIEAMRRFR